MSEPASLVVQCHISADGLRQALAAAEPSVLGWGDWDRLDVEFEPHELPDLDAGSQRPLGEMLRAIRSSAEASGDWLFAYDPDQQALTIGQVLYSDSWPSITYDLSGLRRLGNFIAPGMEPGMIWVHDWIFGQRTWAAVTLSSEGSSILVPEELDVNVEAIFDEVLDPVRDSVMDEHPQRDDLDLFYGA